jgi:hypothetical protein
MPDSVAAQKARSDTTKRAGMNRTRLRAILVMAISAELVLILVLLIR